MEVVLDTSVLRQKHPLRGITARYLEAFADHYGTGVIVPDVVVREMKRWLTEEVRKVFNEVRKVGRSAGRLGIADLLDQPDADRDDRGVIRVLEDFDRALRDLGAFVASIPDGLSHEQVLDRLHAGRKPFSGTGDREKGYRDYLIWETILALGSTEGERDEHGLLPVAFLTLNTADFADESGNLHPELRDEARARGVSVVLYTSIDDFIDTVVVPNLPASARAAAILAEDEAKAILSEFISEQFSKFTPYEIAMIDHPYADEIENATIEALDVISVDDVEDVVDLPGGTAAAEVVVQAEASVDFFIWKADAYGWDDDRFAGLSDWNERYFLGETTNEVEARFRVELEIVDGRLRPVNIDVVEITGL